jgi:ADP-ribose pyrophosphatase
MAVFLATGLKENPLEADEDEFLQVERIPLKRAIEMAEQGEVPDAKSLAALLLARPHLEKYLG